MGDLHHQPEGLYLGNLREKTWRPTELSLIPTSWDTLGCPAGSCGLGRQGLTDVHAKLVLTPAIRQAAFLSWATIAPLIRRDKNCCPAKHMRRPGPSGSQCCPACLNGPRPSLPGTNACCPNSQPRGLSSTPCSLSHC